MKLEYDGQNRPSGQFHYVDRGVTVKASSPIVILNQTRLLRDPVCGNLHIKKQEPWRIPGPDYRTGIFINSKKRNSISIKKYQHPI